jgi:hypothetical protein
MGTHIGAFKGCPYTRSQARFAGNPLGEYTGSTLHLQRALLLVLESMLTGPCMALAPLRSTSSSLALLLTSRLAASSASR